MGDSIAVEPRTPPIIGITGGIASGKSYVASCLESLGCATVNADQMGHEVLYVPDVIERLRQSFGPSILTTEGIIDRKRLAAIVFGDNDEALSNRRKLECIVHPEIRRLAEQKIEQLTSSPTPPRAIIVDAPLLVEAGWVNLCDYILFIDTPDEVRMQRALERGWTRQQWHDREAAQASMEQKRRAATHFIDGLMDSQHLRLRLRELLDSQSER